MKRHFLKDSECRAAVSGELQDGAGLILRTQNPNSKNWVYRYQLDGSRTNMGLGSYPTDLCPKFPPGLRGALVVKSLALGSHLVHCLSLQEFHGRQVAQS